MRRFALFLSVACGAVSLLLAGVLLAELNLPPQPIVAKAVDAVEDLNEKGLAYLGIKPVEHLRRSRFEEAGVVTADVYRAAPGVTLIVGLFGNELGAKLFDRDGTLLHEWPIDLFSTVEDRMQYRFDGLVHGSWLYRNGDLIANMDADGLVRVDACGEIVWQNYERTHHSVFVDDDSFIWSPKHTTPYEVPQINRAKFSFDQIGKFDGDTGELVEVIDLVDVIVEAGLEGIVLPNQSLVHDMMHLNDVETLSADMADAFTLFEAGDVMLNSRHFNQIWILDGETHALKWWQIGPMHGAHDPDFQPDGTITVLDNRPGGPALPENGYMGHMGGSRIIRLDPQSRDYATIFASNSKSKFYTPYRGKHQMLDNGNVLITETDAGRAFEVTPDGTIVWAYVNQWDEDEVGWVMEATRYPEEYRAIGDITCGNNGSAEVTNSATTSELPRLAYPRYHPHDASSVESAPEGRME